MHLETVRRHVKRLEKLNWVSIHKKNGVEFHANEENNKFLTEVFNPKETKLVLSFLENVARMKKIIINNSKHLPHEEKPKLVIDYIEDFIQYI